MNKPKALTLLDMLFRNPYITISRAKELLRASTPAARDAVLALRESGLLEEITGRAWGRVYCATPILRIVESDG